MSERPASNLTEAGLLTLRIAWVMNVVLDSSLESRIGAIARDHAVPLEQVVRQVLADYVHCAEVDPLLWVRVSQAGLTNVWPVEDFSEWCPPDAAE